MLSKIKIIQGDITQMQVDAIVNAANNALLGGGGVDGAIHRAGGSEILEECKKIGGCATGEAVITTAGKLPSKYVIHTVGPIWKDGAHNEPQLLANAYRNSLALAYLHHLKTLAFPNISTGVYGFPKELACEIAFQEVKAFLNDHPEMEEVIFVCFDEENWEIYQQKLSN